LAGPIWQADILMKPPSGSIWGSHSWPSG